MILGNILEDMKGWSILEEVEYIQKPPTQFKIFKPIRRRARRK